MSTTNSEDAMRRGVPTEAWIRANERAKVLASLRSSVKAMDGKFLRRDEIMSLLNAQATREIERCPVCNGIMEHVIGCSEMDNAR